ncbi:hypothetical protein ACIHDR_34360 [Nocardia sp. NPDC052278]|uniref:hypothetical protein n=1 Tax=unclassified Nocardia TaxID=2637762 RepID=UPI0036C3F335
METDGVDAIESAQTALWEDAGKLRSVADSFETVDASRAAQLKAVTPDGASN